MSNKVISIHFKQCLDILDEYEMGYIDLYILYIVHMSRANCL